ncbi:3-hexulose-6-phosphate synthase [Nitratifractor salsuginis]|uniref:3-hexulose-6-phosphate synthase n=1 Tax=Nitratifractor salsuginis (strain DSM 16511 / JCM 12458 / E9I37-1) TaxID=749222 RepID=E6X0X6_NITSE|nr:3-hexulose-6-phosphate synthase [Nitratifractor salsuginis]ADV46908.1 3-hexulose-6-phosphate synthase [Nitratifractor salsuginis DSM 16511]
MKLQLAIDVLTSEEALVLAKKTSKYIDIIEIGTPLIKHEGVRLISLMKALHPKKELLVDLKTMDVGEYEADFCFEAGADIVTVLGVADIKTIEGAIVSAKKHGKKVVVDMINVADKITRAKEVAELGADYVGIHSGIDQQNAGQSPLADLKKLSKAVDIPLVVAGGINLDTLDEIIACKPEVVVVGGAITGAKNPKKIAKKISKKIRKAS